MNFRCVGIKVPTEQQLGDSCNMCRHGSHDLCQRGEKKQQLIFTIFLCMYYMKAFSYLDSLTRRCRFGRCTFRPFFSSQWQQRPRTVFWPQWPPCWRPSWSSYWWLNKTFIHSWILVKYVTILTRRERCIDVHVYTIYTKVGSSCYRLAQEVVGGWMLSDLKVFWLDWDRDPKCEMPAAHSHKCPSRCAYLPIICQAMNRAGNKVQLTKVLLYYHVWLTSCQLLKQATYVRGPAVTWFNSWNNSYAW
jgi:hypothetical protein